jgi:hypothetical protein
MDPPPNKKTSSVSTKQNLHWNAHKQGTTLTVNPDTSLVMVSNPLYFQRGLVTMESK